MAHQAQLKIHGPVAPVFTPVRPNNSINYLVIPHYVEYLIKKGIKAILVGGTSGEAMCLNVSDRKKLAYAWLAACKHRGMRVIVQVGGGPLPDVLELATHAQENMADAILTLPELYFKPKCEEHLVSYMELVGEAASSLPLLYYHFPQMSGVVVDVKRFVELAKSKIPNFRGIKADLEAAEQIQTKNVTAFIGNHVLAPAVASGFKSSIATVTNILPDLVLDIISSPTDKTLQDHLDSFVGDISCEGEWVPVMKYAMGVITGLDMGPPLMPIAPLTKNQKNNILSKLRKNVYISPRLPYHS